MKEFFKKRGNIIVGVLLIIYALTPIVFRPLNNMLWRAIFSGFDNITGMSIYWKNLDWSVWVRTVLFLAMAVALFLRHIVPANALKGICAGVFVVLAIFAVRSFPSYYNALRNYFTNDVFEYYAEYVWGEIARMVCGAIALCINLAAYIIVAVTLFLKKKSKIITYLPVVLFVIGALIYVLGYFLYMVYVFARYADYVETCVLIITTNILPNMLYSVLFAVAMWVFSFCFVAENKETVAQPVAAPTPAPATASAYSGIGSFMDDFDKNYGTQIGESVQAAADIVAKGAAVFSAQLSNSYEQPTASKLTPEQREKLQKLKEAYDIGVLTDEELKDKRKAILGF